jgi:hypothetical protein
MMTMMRYAVLLLLFIAYSQPLAVSAQNARPSEERVYIVKSYRYDPGSSAGNPETGQSLCGTRCNALSADYLNFTEPGGWRVIKVASDRELTVDLNNPFMSGRCICIADEYLVKIDDLTKGQ